MEPSDAERQIAHHARIAGAIAVVVALAELAITEWVHEAYHKYGTWIFALGLVVVVLLYWFVFLVIQRYERRWNAHEAEVRQDRYNRKLVLKEPGDVDGIWVEAAWDMYTKRLMLGSILRISSSGAGFTVEGWSYKSESIFAASDIEVVDCVGHWRGNGSQWTDDGFCCQYNGVESITTIDRGVVLYEFTADGKDQRTMRGAFVGLGLKSAFHILGLRVSTDYSKMSPGRKLEKAKLREFLAHQPHELP